MRAIDLRLLRGAALPTAAVAVLAVIVSGVLAGGKGVLGGVVGGAVVVAFFTVSLVAVAKAGQVFPQLMLPVALGMYVLKVLVLVLFVGAFVDVRWMAPKAFAVTVIACTLTWMVAEARFFLTQRMLYVDPTGGERS